MKLNTRLRLRRWLVWAARIVTGVTFIVSGWAKAVDPWGFIIKVGEYLSVWHLSVPHEAIVTGCAALACIEFATGIMLATGSLKRSSAVVATAMMALMLPLTVYIAVADPVADCGCFGDLWHISNGATLAKNVVLTALAIYLLLRNRTVPGLYAAPCSGSSSRGRWHSPWYWSLPATMCSPWSTSGHILSGRRYLPAPTALPRSRRYIYMRRTAAGQSSASTSSPTACGRSSTSSATSA